MKQFTQSDNGNSCLVRPFHVAALFITVDENNQPTGGTTIFLASGQFIHVKESIEVVAMTLASVK